MLHHVKHLGQIFSEKKSIDFMLRLSMLDGTVLEPSSGKGAIVESILNVGRDVIAIELDETISKDYDVINMDFFDYSVDNKFSTIIGNPPYVKYSNILPATKEKINLTKNIFDDRSNLYLHFIYKCIQHLDTNGELILITPKDFLKATSAIPLNKYMYSVGTITHFYDFSGINTFKKASPDVCIWRFQLGNLSRKTHTNLGVLPYKVIDGFVYFSAGDYCIKLSDIATVKVGAVSGDDEFFSNIHPTTNFVCSSTASNGRLKPMYYYTDQKTLLPHKDRLLQRKIKKFNQNNWHTWGRACSDISNPRIYVNSKTRKMLPFFSNKCKYFDGSILGIFPKKNINLREFCMDLNSVDWMDLGFLYGGRYIFSQRSLENVHLPKKFKKYLYTKKHKAPDS